MLDTIDVDVDIIIGIVIIIVSVGFIVRAYFVTRAANAAVEAAAQTRLRRRRRQQQWQSPQTAEQRAVAMRRHITTTQIAHYDGSGNGGDNDSSGGDSDGGCKLYLSIRNTVYDVSTSPHFYAKGADYHALVARDATRALAAVDVGRRNNDGCSHIGSDDAGVDVDFDYFDYDDDDDVVVSSGSAGFGGSHVDENRFDGDGNGDGDAETGIWSEAAAVAAAVSNVDACTAVAGDGVPIKRRGAPVSDGIKGDSDGGGGGGKGGGSDGRSLLLGVHTPSVTSAAVLGDSGDVIDVRSGMRVSHAEYSKLLKWTRHFDRTYAVVGTLVRTKPSAHESS
jgi:hypothetical protein